MCPAIKRAPLSWLLYQPVNNSSDYTSVGFSLVRKNCGNIEMLAGRSFLGCSGSTELGLMEINYVMGCVRTGHNCATIH